MRISTMTLCAVVAAAGNGPALAQSNLGELLDMGGKKLSKEESVTALSGATLSGETRDGAVFQSDYKADGSYSGSFVSAQNKRTGTTYGKWTVDDNSKVCVDGTIRLYETQPQKGCQFYFKNGDQYYISPSDSDRSAYVLKRAIKK
jgi:hypothetical protein